MVGLESPTVPRNRASSTLKEQKKAESVTDNPAATTTEAPQESPTPWQTLIEVLAQEAEVKITNSTLIDGRDEPINLGAGDVLRLDATEILHPKTGSFLGMVIVYHWRDILKEDQTIGKEGVSSAA